MKEALRELPARIVSVLRKRNRMEELGVQPDEALKEIERQGWSKVRRTAHGYLMRRGDKYAGFGYSSHNGTLGNTQLRMLSKSFALDPPLIDAHLKKEKEMTTTVAEPAVRTEEPTLRTTWGTNVNNPEDQRDIAARVTRAMQQTSMSDTELGRLMGRDELWVRRLKRAEIKVTTEELNALFGVFGKSATGRINTRWYRSRAGRVPKTGTPGGPPLKPAPWVREPEKAEVATDEPPVQPEPEKQPEPEPEQRPEPSGVRVVVEPARPKMLPELVDDVRAAVEALTSRALHMEAENARLQAELTQRREEDAAIELAMETLSKRRQRIEGD